MNGEGNSYDDFRMDPLKLKAIKYLLSQGKNDSEIAVAMDVDRHTVAKIRDRMNGRDEIKSSDEDEERRERLPTEEFQSILKTVKGLAKRVQELERWKNNGYVKTYNELMGYITEAVDPRLGRLEKRSSDIIDDFASYRRITEQLQRDVNVIKEIKKVEFAEFMAKSAKRRLDRDQAEVEANERAVEVFREMERQREQG